MRCRDFTALLLQAYEAESYLVSAQDAHKAAQEHVNLHADVGFQTHSLRSSIEIKICMDICFHQQSMGYTNFLLLGFFVVNKWNVSSSSLPDH